jgi:uncharacterized protein YraI
MKKPMFFLLIVTFILSACSNQSGTTIKSTSTKTPRPTNAPTSIPRATSTRRPTSTPKITLEGCVNVSSVFVRSEPTTQSNSLGGISGGDCVKLTGRDQYSNWVQFQYGSSKGWIYMEYMTTDGNTNNLPVISGFNIAGNSNPTSPSNAPVSTTSENSPTIQPSSSNQTIQDCNTMWGSVGNVVTCKLPRAYCVFTEFDSGDVTFCNDYTFPNHSFTFVSWYRNLTKYNGKCLILNGQLSTYEGKLQIVGNLQNLSICN